MSTQEKAADAREVVATLGRAAKRAARSLASAPSAKKNLALSTLAALLTEEREAIFAANRLDLERARAEGLSEAFLDRLAITDKVLERMAEGFAKSKRSRSVGEIEALRPRPTGISVGRMRVPLGVIAMIFESRPNVIDRRFGARHQVGQRHHSARRPRSA